MGSSVYVPDYTSDNSGAPINAKTRNLQDFTCIWIALSVTEKLLCPSSSNDDQAPS